MSGLKTNITMLDEVILYSDDPRLKDGIKVNGEIYACLLSKQSYPYNDKRPESLRDAKSIITIKYVGKLFVIFA